MRMRVRMRAYTRESVTMIAKRIIISVGPPRSDHCSNQPANLSSEQSSAPIKIVTSPYSVAAN